MSEGVVFGLSFALQDAFSYIADKIENKMSSLSNAGDNLANKLNKAFTGLTVGLGLLTTGGMLTAGLASTLEEAGKFSDLYADVRKTTGATVEEVQNLDKAFQQIDTRTGLDGLFEIAKFGGAIGVSVKEMESFTQATDQAVVALGDEFGGGIEGVVKPLGTLKTLFKDTANLQFGDAINKIGSSINQLGAEGTATGGNVADFAKRIGALGNLAPEITQTLGLGAALEELGINSEIGAGGISNIMLTAGQNIGAFAKQVGLTTKQFQDLMNTDPNAMFLKLAKSMQGMSNTQIIDTMKKLKIGSQESIKVMSLLANQTDLVMKRQESASKAFEEGTSLSNEFALKNETLAASFEKTKNRLQILSKNFGEGLAPAISPIAGIFNDLISAISNFFATDFGKQIARLIGLLAVSITSIGAVMVVVNGAKLAFALFGSTIVATATAMLPFIAIGALLYGTYQLINQSLNSFNDFLEKGIQTANPFVLRMQQFGGVLRGLYEIFKSVNNEGFTLPEEVNNGLKKLGILDFVLSLGTYIVRARAFLQGFAGAFISFGEQVGRVVTPFFSFLKNIFLDLVRLFFNFGKSMDKLQSPMQTFTDLGAKIANYVIIPLQWGLKLVSFGFDILRGVLSVLVGVVSGFLERFSWVQTAFQYVLQAIQPLTTWFQSLSTTTEQSGSKMQTLVDIGNILGQVLSGTLTAALYIVGTALNVVITIVGGLVSAFEFLFNLIRTVFNYIAESDTFKTLTSFLGSGLSNIGSAIGSFFGSEGQNKLATQASGVQASSSQVMQGFQAQTVANKQAETIARTPVVNNTNNNNVNMKSTPLVIQLDKQTLGTTMIDFLAETANN